MDYMVVTTMSKDTNPSFVYFMENALYSQCTPKKGNSGSKSLQLASVNINFSQKINELI